LLDLARSLPTLRQFFPTHAAFAQATADDLLRALGQPYRSLRARTLASTVFLNRGTRFEPRPLPLEAQLAPAFGVTVADFDGDGAEDLFLAQNSFDLPAGLPRADGGRGLLLRGQGDGSFQPIPAHASGIRILGEQRACAVADFDEDGRADLVVGQNAAAACLLRNASGRPGLRVRLRGPVGNPRGVGAVLRLVFPDRTGPARVIPGGSGYASQDSTIPVLATPSEPRRLVIRWPHLPLEEREVPPGAREILVTSDP